MAHYIKPNHSTQVPSRVIFFDTETVERVSPLNRRRCAEFFRLGVAIGGRYHRGELVERWELPFTNIATFWHRVWSEVAPNHTTWLMAHNLIFDLVQVRLCDLFETGELVEDRPRSVKPKEGNGKARRIGSRLAVVSDPPNIIGCRHVGTAGRLVMVDTFNYFQTSVAAMGEQCGLEKLPMPHFMDDDKQWFEYCHRDVEILERTMCQLFSWCKRKRMGVFRYTAAGLSMSAYRHGRMKKVVEDPDSPVEDGHHIADMEVPIKILPHDNMDVKRFERESYFGGRTECFRHGAINERVHHLDVASLFPSVMNGQLYPVKLKRWDLEREILPLAPAINFRHSIAEVLIDSDESELPFKYGKQTLYPRGQFVTVLCGPELEAASKQGLIQGVGRWANFEMDDVFSFFVRDLWAMRFHYQTSNNKLYDQFVKMLLNGLYGKFGQRSQAWVPTDEHLIAEPWTTQPVINTLTGNVTKYRGFGWSTEKQVERGEKKGTFPAISAFVTSYARMRMNTLRAIAGPLNVFYQGVDSLIVNTYGIANLDHAGEICNGQLGKLRLIRSADGCQLNGCGDYALGDFVAKAGRKSNAVFNDDGTWTETVFGRASSLFQTGGRNFIEKYCVTKRPREGYTKGVVGADGWVEPFQFPLSDDGKSPPEHSRSANP